MSKSLGPVLLALTVAFSACAAPISSQPDDVGSERSVTTACEKVESTLVALGNTQDPVTFADAMGIELNGSAVRVVIDVYPDQQLTAIPGLVESRDGHFVQALIEPRNLCVLGARPAVRFIRSAYQPKPLSIPSSREGAR